MPSIPWSAACARAAALLIAVGVLGIAACRRDAAAPADRAPAADRPPAAASADPRPLPSAPAAERTLAPGEVHPYEIELAAGEVVRVLAEQRGADLALAVVDPRGAERIRVDRPLGATGVEWVTILAESPGRHRLEVREAGTPGAYRLRVVAGPRPAEPADRLHAAAERAFYGARADEKRGASARPAAARGYEEALRLWSEAGDRHGRAIAGFALGEMLFDLGERERAESELAAALPLLIAEGETAAAAAARNTLGALARAAGRLDEAAGHYDRARETAVAAGNEGALYRALQNRGVLHIYRGEIVAAVEALTAAREGWRRLGEPLEEVETLLRISSAYFEAGEADLAETPLREARDLAGRHHLRPQAASALAQLATVAILREEWSRGEWLLRRAIPVFEEAGLRHDLAVALNNLGLIHRLSGRLQEARDEFERAGALFTVPRDAAMMRMHVAWTLEGMGEAERALAIYPDLRAEFHRLDEPDLVASVDYGWARAALALGRLEEARRRVEAAIARVERRVLGFGDRSLGAAYAARKEDYYALEVEILMRLHERDPAAGYDARAVAASESGRARQLVASLAAARDGRTPVVDPALAAAHDDLYRRIRGLEFALGDRDALADGGSLVVGRKLRLLHAEAERLEARIAAAEPRYAALVAPPPFDLARFRARLDDGTEALVVSLGERRSWLWWITRERLESHPLAGREALNAHAAEAHRLLARSYERRAAGRLATVLERLSEALLGPVAAGLGGGRLVVVPDGGLHYVPWAVLPAPAGAPAAGEPLIDHFEVVALPSLAVLDELRRRAAARPAPPGLLAVVADPVTDGADERLPAAARGPADPSAPVLPDDLATLAATLGIQEFPRLPHAREEAEAILALVPPEQRWAALGFDANRDAMFSAPFGRYRYLHFAVHVVPSEQYPHLSGLVLSRYAPDGARRDALLRLGDVFRLDLPVDLVVLSGCRSGLGKQLRGEGIVGLTRGFMAAGAPRVVVSLWDVNDHATSELMTELYRGLLRDGLRPAAALRAAQQELRRRPGRRAPFYWAGFVLQGDWR